MRRTKENKEIKFAQRLMKITKIIFILRESSGVPFFSAKICNAKPVRMPLVEMIKLFCTSENAS